MLARGADGDEATPAYAHTTIGRYRPPRIPKDHPEPLRLEAWHPHFCWQMDETLLMDVVLTPEEKRRIGEESLLRLPVDVLEQILIQKEDHETILEAATRIFPRRRRRSRGRGGGFHRKRRTGGDRPL